MTCPLTDDPSLLDVLFDDDLHQFEVVTMVDLVSVLFFEHRVVSLGEPSKVVFNFGSLSKAWKVLVQIVSDICHYCNACRSYRQVPGSRSDKYEHQRKLARDESH